MLSLLIKIYLFLVVVAVTLTYEGSNHAKSTYTQVKSDISTRGLGYGVNTTGMYRRIFSRSLHTVERSLENP
jgi:hypothetical protein